MNYLLTSLVGLVAFFGSYLPTKDLSLYDAGAKASITLGAAAFPTSIPSITNPAGTDSVATVSHSAQHAFANDNITALANKLGTGVSIATNNTIFVGTGAGASGFSTSATSTNFLATNLTATNATTTNFIATASTTLFDFTFHYATGTQATTTSLYNSGTASTTTINANTGNIGNLTVRSCTGCSTGTTATTYVPMPSFGIGAFAQVTLAASTTANVCLVEFNKSVTFSSIGIINGNDMTQDSNQVVTGLYDSSGALQYATTSANMPNGTSNSYTMTFSPTVTVNPGMYYQIWIPKNGNNIRMEGVNVATTFNGKSFQTTGQPKWQGTLSVTAGTAPASITPSSIATSTATGCPYVRYDS